MASTRHLETYVNFMSKKVVFDALLLPSKFQFFISKYIGCEVWGGDYLRPHYIYRVLYNVVRNLRTDSTSRNMKKSLYKNGSGNASFS